MRVESKPDTLATFASLFLIAISTTVLAGWILDLAILKGLFGSITMKANAALGLLASGIALGLRASRRPGAPYIGRACAAFASALGAFTLSEHVAGWDLGIDELLFHEAPGAAATTRPGRMGPNASLSLTLGGVALWQLYSGAERAVTRAQVIGAVMAVFALVPTVGYLYGATQLYAIARYTGIAVNTGISLLVLSLGILAARPDTGPVAAIVSDTPHGMMARRLALPAVLIPLTFGYLHLAGERAGLYDAGFGSSMLVVAVIVLLSLTIWRTAVALERSDTARRLAQRDRDDLLVRERAARERAERADHAKDEFIAALSHELRTPLNAVVGWMHMLQQGAVPEAGRTKATEAIARNADMLARLIEDLLQTSRIAAGQVDLSEAVIDMTAVVQAAVDSVLPAASAAGVAVTIEAAPPLPPVVGDAQRLQQVLWNLLSNAIRFSPPGGHVRVETAAADGILTIRVRDEGQGIDPAFLPYVFDRFRQREGPGPRKHGGLGLGLYIARHLVERHGGTIRAHSDGAGTGAVFTIQLPAAPDAALTTQEAGTVTRS